MFTRWLEETFFVDIATSVINYIEPVDHRTAKGLVAETYRQMRDDFQLAPPISVHSPVPLLFAGAWMIWRESLVAGSVNRAVRHTVGAAVSQINKCPFCVQANSVFLFGSQEHEAAKAFISNDEPGNWHTNTQLDEVRKWALANLTPEAEIIQSPPFSPQDAPEIIGTALTFHYIDRISDVFLDPSPMPLPGWLQWMEGAALRLSGFVFGRRIVQLDVPPGESLSLLPEVAVPDEFAWAANKPSVAQAFARFSAVLEKAAKEQIAPGARQLVQAKINAWRGEPPGLSRNWVEEIVTELKQKNEQAAARLMLLTALAPYQVDQNIVTTFRHHYPTDQDLITATSWAGFTATRRIGSWLQPPTNL